MAIRSTIISLPDVYGVYGFGSFFRSEIFNDVDLLIVLSDSCDDLLKAFYSVRHALEQLSSQLSLKFDLTFLTQRECLERPLREMDLLVPILERALTVEAEPSNNALHLSVASASAGER